MLPFRAQLEGIVYRGHEGLRDIGYSRTPAASSASASVP